MHFTGAAVFLVVSVTALAPCQEGKPPPARANGWWPSAGAVILGGGGFTQGPADALVDRIIRLAGGADARIVVIPTASVKLASLPAAGPLPPTVAAVREHLESRGARQIILLHTRDREVANSEEFVKPLRTANAVFLTGGASRVLDEIYHDTLVEREIKAVLERGGVVAGDSAGAITLGDFWLDWDSRAKSLAKATDGLGVLPRVTVTPHVESLAGDERTSDVLTYLLAHPGTIGINIQEDTFLVLRGSTAEVGGKGGVSIFDPAKDRSKAYLRLASSERHDLAK